MHVVLVGHWRMPKPKRDFIYINNPGSVYVRKFCNSPIWFIPGFRGDVL